MKHETYSFTVGWNTGVNSSATAEKHLIESIEAHNSGSYFFKPVELLACLVLEPVEIAVVKRDSSPQCTRAFISIIYTCH
jgi:hypothetical protein